MKHISISLLLIILLSFLSWAAWYFEIYFTEAHSYHSWPRRDLYTPYFSVLLCTISTSLPFLLKKELKVTFRNFVLAILFQFCIGFLSWFILKLLIQEGPMVRRIEREFRSIFPFIAFSILALLPILHSMIYWLSIYKLFRKIHFANFFLFLFPYFGTLIFTFLFYLLFYWNDEFSFNPEIVFKNGVPVGFMTFCLGLCGIIISRQEEYIPKLK